MTRLCPDCKKPLIPQAYFGVNLDICHDCAGIWFDQGELGREQRAGKLALVEIDREVVPELKKHPSSMSGRACPDCLEALTRYQYLYNSPIELDGCSLCNGFWIEDGELNKIQDWLGSSALRLQQQGQEHPEDAAALGKYAYEHDAAMRRADSLRLFFSIINWPHNYGRLLFRP